APDTDGCTNDTWTQTKNDVPDPESKHVAVWTGSEMLVGGTGWGGRYSPATDTWAEITRSGSPGGRTFATAVWTGTEMIVWGGYVDMLSSAIVRNTGGRYNPSTGTWTATS